MKKLISLILCFCLFSSLARADGAKASLENSSVPLGEMVMLTVTYSGADNVKPDFSVLEKNFQIYSTSTSIQTSIINGVSTTQKEWNLGVVPKVSGKLTIPEISVGKYKTKPLQLEVLSAGNSNNSTNKVQTDNKAQSVGKGQNSPEGNFGIEMNIDEKNPYLQQEVNATIVVHDKVGLTINNGLTVTNGDDWIVRKLKEAEVKQNSDGSNDIIFSLALFPQKSGTLELPIFNIEGTYDANLSNNRQDIFGQFADFNRLFNSQKPVSLFTSPQKIEVKPEAKDYDYYWWLPAKDLNMVAKWEKGGRQFEVGETYVRDILVGALGVVNTQLPELEFANTSELKQYPETPQTTSKERDGYVLSQATTRVVIIPQKSGQITIPPVKLKWFDITNNKVSEKVIPGEVIKVVNNSGYKENTDDEYENNKGENDNNKENLSNQQNSDDFAEMTENVTPQNNTTTDEKKNSGFMKKIKPEIAVFLLLLAFMAGVLFAYLLILMRQDKKNQDAINIDKIHLHLNKKDYRKARDEMIAWAIDFLHISNINNLNDLSAEINDAEFSEQMQILNRILYTGTDEMVNTNLIIAKLKSAQKKQKHKKKEDPLPQLYK